MRFDTIEEAYDWIADEVDNECCDNFRFTYVDDEAGMEAYYEKQLDGCCGSIDRTVLVGGREALVGCNYGH